MFNEGVFAAKGLPLLIAGALLAADLVTASHIEIAVGAIVAYFTIRNLQRSYWRNVVDERDAEIVKLKKDIEEGMLERAKFAEDQRELRHGLKTQIAHLSGQVEIEKAKHDLSAVFSRLDAVEGWLAGRQPMFDAMADGVQQQSELLGEILAELKAQSTERRT